MYRFTYIAQECRTLSTRSWSSRHQSARSHELHHQRAVGHAKVHHGSRTPSNSSGGASSSCCGRQMYSTRRLGSAAASWYAYWNSSELRPLCGWEGKGRASSVRGGRAPRVAAPRSLQRACLDARSCPLADFCLSYRRDGPEEGRGAPQLGFGELKVPAGRPRQQARATLEGGRVCVQLLLQPCVHACAEEGGEAEALVHRCSHPLAARRRRRWMRTKTGWR
jgi:hypothetical protein